MVSSSGSSSGYGSGSSGSTTTTLPTNNGSAGHAENVADPRKQRRMLSNRESARRSRMRKQKHLDDLVAQVAQLRGENNHILTTYRLTTQRYLAVEAANSMLRTQYLELTNRLHSLNEIFTYMNVLSWSDLEHQPRVVSQPIGDSPCSISLLSVVNQSIVGMASPDMFLQ